jgi:CDP-glucose 4,6-dehydratase
VGLRERALEAVAVDPGFWRDRPVLVTGHTGFKGSWLVLWLRSMGARVTGFAEPPPPGRPSLFELAGAGEGIESVAGDVRDVQAVRAALERSGAEVVLHLAAQPIVLRSYREPAETFAVNVDGTANVLDAARAAGGVRSVVVVTSDKCYENRGLERGYREDEPLGGSDPYSASKAAQELVAQAYRRSFGLPIATVRAGNVIGGGDFAADRLVPDLMRAAVAGETVRVRNPDAVRPWQHVLCPLEGYLTVAERVHADAASFADAWNFGPADGDALPVGRIVERLGELWPGGIASEEAPDPAAPGEARTLHLDSAKARSLLGWEPAWDLGGALEAVVEWYSAWGGGGDLRAVTLAQVERYREASGGGGPGGGPA